MIARLLPALKKYLTAETADLRLLSPEKDQGGNEIIRAPRVFIGDFPAKRAGGPERMEFPCIVLVPVSGANTDGEETIDIAALIGVYNNEEGDGEALEMDLVTLYAAVSRACCKCLFAPLESLFLLTRDEKGRTLHWQRSGDPNQPRPYAQKTIISRWTAPGWE